MTDFKRMIVTATGLTAMQCAIPGKLPQTLKSVFRDVADVTLIGNDSAFCARFNVPADKVEDFKAIADKRGYVAEADYTLKINI